MENSKNRIIKFRTWDKSKRKMEGVMGLSFDYCQNIGIKGEEIGVVFGEPHDKELSIEKENYEKRGLGVANHHPNQNTCVLMQFTGLKDKNGKEIYESDYCMVGDVKVEIIFVDGAFGFEDPLKLGTLALLPQFNLEVIGNIYESK